MEQSLYEQVHDQLFTNGHSCTPDTWIVVTLNNSSEIVQAQAMYPSRGNIRIRQYVGQNKYGDIARKKYRWFRFNNKKELLYEGIHEGIDDESIIQL